MQESHVGEGKVTLIAGGGKIYTDIAARFCRSEHPVEVIVNSEYNAQIVHNILECGHLAATEFDFFIFGVEGFSRVCETQLVRKRHASYLIKSGRLELNGKRKFSIVTPEKASKLQQEVRLPDGTPVHLSGSELCGIIEQWYNQGVGMLPEEDLRYFKPQATEFRGIIGMNAHALLDWFKIRCCLNAQAEIRDLAWKMLYQCRHVAPDIFNYAGPSCKVLGYCPEDTRQHKNCKKHYMQRHEAVKFLEDEMYKRNNPCQNQQEEPSSQMKPEPSSSTLLKKIAKFVGWRS